MYWGNLHLQRIITHLHNSVTFSITALLLTYIGVQLVLPYSHFITRGYNTWTDGLYGYSWDMMINSWETLHQKVTVRNYLTGEERYLDPDVSLQI